MAGYRSEYINKFYARHIADGTLHGDEFRALCPGHNESNPSFSANMTTGVFICFTEGCKLCGGGNMAEFLAKIEDIPISEAHAQINEEYKSLYPTVAKKTKKTKSSSKFPFTHDDIIARVEALFANPEKLALLHEKCLWTTETIQKFEIGYDAAENAYWLPIRENIDIHNIRKYRPASSTKWSSITGFGVARLFPLENTEGNTIFLMEGEKDCILANQLGLNAVTATGGAGSFKNEWKQYFVDKEVVICYDVDAAGRVGANKVFSMIGRVSKTCKIVELPIDTPDNADFTDYILAGNTVQDFLAVVSATGHTEVPSDSPVDIDPEVISTSLDLVDEEGLFYKRTKLNVRVIGTESSPFIIPRDLRVTCNRDNGNKCASCGVGDTGGVGKLTINEETPRLLDLIECKSSERTAILREMFNIPLCKKFVMKEKDHQAVNRVAIIPSIDEITYDEESQNQTYVERDLYFLGERLIANTDYEIEALAIPSPKDQSLVHLGYKVKPADSSIEEFKMTPELKEQLEIFSCSLEKK